MHTKDKLAEALREVGLEDMAAKAEKGWYHDFLSPLDLPEMTLVNDLAVAAQGYPDRAVRIMTLRKRVMNGDFDASTEESDEWAQSPEGQEAFRLLMPQKKDEPK